MSTKPPHAPSSQHASEEEIRDYAYHLYDQSGFVAGRDLDNWLEAKDCLNSGLPKDASGLRQHQNSQRRK